MGFFSVDKKTGFKAYTDVEILTPDNKLFYYNKYTGKVLYFNLPAGIYSTKNPIYKLFFPVRFPMVKVPKREQFNLKAPQTWKVKFKDVPQKAVVNYFKGEIILDYQFENASRPVKEYIFAHERGHQYYKNEPGADAYAANYMLKQGYNPRQIIAAQYATLSERSEDRKRQLMSNFEKTYNI